MRVFVAGGTGAIGRRLVPQLVARGHRVTATTTSAGKLGLLRQLGAEGVVMDGLDAAAVGEAVGRPEAVVNQMTALSETHAGKLNLRKPERFFATTIRLRSEGPTICSRPRRRRVSPMSSRLTHPPSRIPLSRILGSVSEAEDAVQETWLRYEASPTEPASAKAFLSAVVTRISTDVLRSARVQRETYVGPWLPEPLLTDPYEDPARSAELADSLSMAALLLLERLSPIERAVFVLRDVFGFGFPEIASAVGTGQRMPMRPGRISRVPSS